MVFAEHWPARPVTMMVAYPTGGPLDAIARIISGPLGKELGQEVIVENLGDVSGALAAQKVLAAPADGYYVFQGSASGVFAAPLGNALVQLQSDDFRLVHPVSDAVLVCVTRRGLPVSSIDELVQLAKAAHERPLTCAMVGVGSLNHFVLEDLRQRTGITLRPVPYDGNAPMLQDMLDGRIDSAVLAFHASVSALVVQGAIKVICQFGEERSKLLPDVPTAGEGRALKQFGHRTWSGLMVPRRTPELLVLTLHAAIGKVLLDPVVRMQLAAQTQDAAAPMSLGEASRFFASEAARYRAIAEAINLLPR